MSSIAISLFGVFELPRFIDSAGKKLIGASSLTPWKTDGAQSKRGFQQARESYRLRFLMKSGFSKHADSTKISTGNFRQF